MAEMNATVTYPNGYYSNSDTTLTDIRIYGYGIPDTMYGVTQSTVTSIVDRTTWSFTDVRLDKIFNNLRYSIRTESNIEITRYKNSDGTFNDNKISLNACFPIRGLIWIIPHEFRNSPSAHKTAIWTNLSLNRNKINSFKYLIRSLWDNNVLHRLYNYPKPDDGYWTTIDETGNNVLAMHTIYMCCLYTFNGITGNRSDIIVPITNWDASEVIRRFNIAITDWWENHASVDQTSINDINNHMTTAITAYINELKDPDTKTYTNSTWSSSKTWYIKVSFKTQSAVFNGSNVVNYDTNYVTKVLYTYYTITY